MPKNSWLLQTQQHTQSVLTRFLNDHLSTTHTELAQAIRYAVLSPGKRLRPSLVYAVAHTQACPDHEDWDLIAAAVELIHAYSLVHDDLPAMDNDDERRGIASCHRRFNESTAILVGDACQTLSFRLCASLSQPAMAAQAVAILADAAGPRGMIQGQFLDMHPQYLQSEDDFLAMHRAKTGALIECSMALALLLAAPSQHDRKALTTLATLWGQAYQMQDDLADAAEEANITTKRSPKRCHQTLQHWLTDIAATCQQSPQPTFWMDLTRSFFPQGS